MRRVALVIGGAECVSRDVPAARLLCDQLGIVPEIYVANDQIAKFPGEVVACTLHPDKLRKWMDERRNNKFPDPKSYYCHTGYRGGASQGVPLTMIADWGGSSGLFGFVVARLHGHDRIIFCGVPMDSSTHFVRGLRWTAVSAFTRSWNVRKTEIQQYARSMSGWTAELIGKPDEEWLQCP